MATKRKTTTKTKSKWKAELADLVATAQTAKEKAAMVAFQKALGPYLDNPELLRTVLSKIQRRMTNPEIQMIVNQGEFKSMAEVKKRLPKGVRVVKL